MFKFIIGNQELDIDDYFHALFVYFENLGKNTQLKCFHYNDSLKKYEILDVRVFHEAKNIALC